MKFQFGCVIIISSRDEIFHIISPLESLTPRRWLRKSCLFYKIFHEKFSWYLFKLNPPNNNVYATRSSQSNKISTFKTGNNFYKGSFVPAVISEWNSLDVNILNSFSINVLKKELVKFIRPEPNSTYNINNTKGLKLLTDCGLDSVN